MTVADTPFWKMTGSGNDFVFFDARTEGQEALLVPDVIGAICDRRRGVGADGIVLFENDPEHAYRIRYFNRDGSLAEFCGNASLCSVRLAVELGVVQPGQRFTFSTSSGAIAGQIGQSGPEVGMPPVKDLAPAFEADMEAGETRIGFARVGVPHIVVACANVELVPVETRGRALRHNPALSAGANVNFVSRGAAGWTYRTYERGVEEETLACGSGSVAVAALLMAWNGEKGPVRLRTRSGSTLIIHFTDGTPSLAGEGRLVFEGRSRDLFPAT